MSGLLLTSDNIYGLVNPPPDPVNDLPEFIPKYLPSVYKDKGWKGPANFFGYEKKRRAPDIVRKKIKSEDMFSYDLAKKFVHTFNLENKDAFERFVRINSDNEVIFPDKLPTNPESFYKENGWKGWQDFLGYKIKRIVY